MPKAHFTHASAQGARAEQQDRSVVLRLSKGYLLAVMDGHGGSATAELLAKELPAAFERAMSTQRDRVDRALKEAVSLLAEKTSQETSGSTLSIVFIPEDQTVAHTAVLGDSPVVILDAQDGLHVSPLHNARSNLKERSMALARGARYSEGYLEDPRVPGEGLQMSRALGDRNLARILNREPEVDRILLGKGSLVVLASDGILNSFDIDVETQLKHVADLAKSGMTAQDWVEDALRRQTGDNVTVIIWKA
jgi:serine/threonine protein phosphatase PrpC